MYEALSYMHADLPFKGMRLLRGTTICLNCGLFFGGDHPVRGRQCTCKDTKGSTAKPDILIRMNGGLVFDNYGVVRVDGGIHTKNRKHMMWDYHQVQAMQKHHYKVFIVKNEELKSELCANAVALYILTMMQDDNLYQQYLRSGDMQERCRRPL